ncbi:MAG TPA: SIMPL domain-containing protein, partial [Herpetosiphonaceae bacterium]|nr:SIMPL domain-containing protein [Herpetosiphonaceae bacterium]
SVTIRNVAEAGDVLDQIVSAGANTVWGISFGIGDPKALQAAARDAAIADARTRAEAMAQAAQGSVGQILSISENIGQVPQPFLMRGGAEAAAADSVPVATGEQAVTAQVQITYELR